MDKPPKAILYISHCAASFLATPLELGSSVIVNFDCSILLGLRFSSCFAPITSFATAMWLLPVFLLKCFFLKPHPNCVCCILDMCFRRAEKDGGQQWSDVKWIPSSCLLLMLSVLVYMNFSWDVDAIHFFGERSFNFYVTLHLLNSF